MRSVQRGRCRWTWLAIALLAAPAVHAQANIALAGKPGIVREVDDPHTGVRWLLVRDWSHPGGPGRMVTAAEFESAQFECKDRSQLPGGWRNSRPADSASFRPVVRAGDRLTVEEHTRVVDAYLEAVALGPASVGSVLNVRLKVGDRVVRAVALGPGRAAFAPELEARP
jgi:hypothetical protein